MVQLTRVLRFMISWGSDYRVLLVLLGLMSVLRGMMHIHPIVPDTPKENYRRQKQQQREHHITSSTGAAQSQVRILWENLFH